jgi:peptide/nickel transport system substrate-binding protein
MLAAAGPFAVALVAGPPAVAQKSGGILRVPWFDSPPSLSLLEESTVAANRPMMGVFNNLVIYKQDVPQNSMKSIVPDLAAKLVVERGGDGADDATAPGCQMA